MFEIKLIEYPNFRLSVGMDILAGVPHMVRQTIFLHSYHL